MNTLEANVKIQSLSKEMKSLKKKKDIKKNWLEILEWKNPIIRIKSQ